MLRGLVIFGQVGGFIWVRLGNIDRGLVIFLLRLGDLLG